MNSLSKKALQSLLIWLSKTLINNQIYDIQCLNHVDELNKLLMKKIFLIAGLISLFTIANSCLDEDCQDQDHPAEMDANEWTTPSSGSTIVGLVNVIGNNGSVFSADNGKTLSGANFGAVAISTQPNVQLAASGSGGSAIFTSTGTTVIGVPPNQTVVISPINTNRNYFVPRTNSSRVKVSGILINTTQPPALTPALTINKTTTTVKGSVSTNVNATLRTNKTISKSNQPPTKPQNITPPLNKTTKPMTLTTPSPPPLKTVKNTTNTFVSTKPKVFIPKLPIPTKCIKDSSNRCR